MQNKAIEVFYLFFQGILTFQVLIFGVLYIVTGRKDLRWYSLFLLFAAIYFFINAPFTFFGIPEEAVWNSVWYDYTNTPLIIFENFFYLLFLQSFFSDFTNDKKINVLFRSMLWLVPCILLFFIILTSFNADKQFIFYTVKLITVFPAMVVAYIVLKNKLPFATLVAKGLLCTIAGTLLTVCMIVLRNNGVHHLFTDGYPLFFIRLGILGDMIFYMAAILKKWHFQEKQLAVEKLQSQLAVEKVRNKIGSQLHDDIGSTLSGVSMYSHMAGVQLQNGEHEKVKQTLGIIQKNTNDIVNKLGVLVWSVNPMYDSVQVMLEKLEQYGLEMCRARNIIFKTKGNLLTNLSLSEEERYHIFSIFKEAINNAVKYSNATHLHLEAKQEAGYIIISLQDNGEGFDIDKVKKGNGLNNMEQRAKEIGGILDLKSIPDEGTVLHLKITR